MSSSYYYGEESGSRKYLESLVPIIILVLIAIVLVGKTTNVFCEVPGLSNALCSNGGVIKIAIIGSLEEKTGDTGATVVNAPELRALLDGKLGRACNMQYQVFLPDDLTYVQTSLLKNYDLLILSGDRMYTRPVRTAVESYLESGGKLVIIGDAATKDPEDALYNGWGHIKVPIELRRSASMDSTEIPVITLNSPLLRIVDLNNPINVGYGLKMNLTKIEDKPTCSGSLKVIDINPLAGGTISILTGANDDTGKESTIPAVVEQKGIMGGSVYYFSFDPGCTPNMWISAVQEITGKQTCHLS